MTAFPVLPPRRPARASAPRFGLRLSGVFLLATLAIASAATPFAHEGSDLKPDPAARFGTLPNGVRYVVRANAEPKDRASLRLLVETGSFMETESQRGLAHFLEHMAFNGSTHFPAGSLVEKLQHLGMSFGADTNASTGFDQTIYQLELPDTKPATLAEGLQIFTDYAGGLDLLAEKIEKERGIILSEKRTRDSVEFRTMMAGLEFELGGTLLATRMPIGVEDVLTKAGRAEFVDYYNTWYRPDRLVVVAVGDFDAAKLEQQVIAAFSPLAARAPARPAPALGKLPSTRELRVKFHPEAEAPVASLTISSITPFRREPDTVANRLKVLPRELAVGMLNRRLANIARAGTAAFIQASVGVEEQYDFFRQATIAATCKPEQWAAALSAIDQELRRALQYPFQPDELAETVANVRNSLEQATKAAATRHSAGLAGQILGGVVEQSVFTTPADNQALIVPALEKMTPNDCMMALRAVWSARGRSVFVTGNVKFDGDPVAAITSAYESAHTLAVAAPDKVVTAPFAYTNFGAEGKVTLRQDVRDLDLTQVEFANGVRLNLKKTAFEANRIVVGVRIGGGQLTRPKDQDGLSMAANETYILGGLGKHSAEELQRIMAGKTVNAGFRALEDAFQLSGVTNAKFLAREFQFLCAFATDPGFRPEALRQLRQNIPPYYNSLAQTVEGPLALQVPRLINGGDDRFGTPSQANLLARTSEELRAWLKPELATGPIEISVVGDFDLDAAIAAVAQTFGALPARHPKPDYADARRVTLLEKPLQREFRVPTKLDRGIVVLAWPTGDGRDNHRNRRLTLLATVFGDRLRVKVREQMGGTYSPSAAYSGSDTYANYSLISTQIIVAPDRAREVAEAARAIAASLAQDGLTADEFDRAKQPVLTGVRTSERTNGYWISMLNGSQEKPQQLDWARDRLTDSEAMTKADLDALAKQYLSPERASEFISLPEATAK